MPQARAEAEFQLARSLLAHDGPRSATVAGAAARRFRTVGSEAWAVRAEAIRLRALLAHAKPGVRLSRTIDEVEAVVTELSRRGFRSDVRALRFARDAARSRSADPPARIARVRQDDSLEVRVLASEARAARSSALGRDADAQRHAAAGLAELSTWQSSFGSLEMLASVAMHGAGVIHEGVSAAVRTRRPDAVFRWSEHARHFAQQVSPVRPPHDPELAEDLAQLRMLRTELQTSDWASDARVASLRRRVSERQWVGTAGAEGPPHASLDELRAVLDGETALVTFLYSRETLTCLVVPPPSSGPPAILDLPWREIRPRIDGLRADLEASATTRAGAGVRFLGTTKRSGLAARLVQQALDARLAELSRLLVERAMAVAGDPRRVVITAPGALRGMPWTMLPALRGRAVTLARSASRWVSQRDDEVSLRNAGFVVGPGIARGIEEAQTAASAWELEAERLSPGTGASVACVLDGDRAKVDGVTALAEEVDVLHVIAHGRHAAEAPMLSGFELADGPLFGYDIDLIQRPPTVVVLSACELGRSSVRWGEEAVGMTRAWLHAGTRCVIAAPVTVADDVACELLGAMHEGLAARLPPAEALALAVQDTGVVAPFLAHGAGF
ncbi:CHAT domain-containing protein [Microbacterium betulae]|uniref:CHAT domain-containing protein n=1 Tax=Microbacterium betulae TaxID=2981139 RepID=A0AA97FIG8_9MICO|nr:CHAT domain-containing protein [Microbacterium sp. AB]WOF22644.1 CHAT domain-containing protein [Microbacterium sp. AB]